MIKIGDDEIEYSLDNEISSADSREMFHILCYSTTIYEHFNPKYLYYIRVFQGNND